MKMGCPTLLLCATFWIAVLVLVPSVHAARTVNFQVAAPPPLPRGAKQCHHTLIKHTFENSYYKPAIAKYSPPTDCGPVGSWAGISMNLTVTSNGIQYDRLGVFTFHDVEIWRTSTSEPAGGDGIIWTYVKDMTRFIPLFSKSGDLALEIDNVVEGSLNGKYESTVTVTFFASSTNHPAAKKADLIIPISKLSGSNPASVPPDTSAGVTFPNNTIEVYAEIFASGNSEKEEFWYRNAANDFSSTKNNGPFREVRLLVDGKVAGAAFPYPVIFTGGFVPSAWSPIAAYGAHDQPTYFIDLTPLVPNLVDGKAHTFTLGMSSAEKDHAINSNWFVTGLVQVITDPSNKPTTGKITKYEVEPFAQSSISSSVDNNGDTVTVKATRSVHIESQIISGSGETNNVVFTQDLMFSNAQTTSKGSLVHVFQTSSGQTSSTHNGVKSVVDIFSYPLDIKSTPGYTFAFDRSYDRTVLPAPFMLRSVTKEHQIAFGSRTSPTRMNNNTLTYTDSAGNTYDREVNSAQGQILSDHQGGTLAPKQQFAFATSNCLSDFAENTHDYAPDSENKQSQFRIIDHRDGSPLTTVPAPELARFPEGWLDVITSKGDF